ARAGLLPLWLPAVYAGLELLALGALLAWFIRAKNLPRPEATLVIGLLPFLLAWHSLLVYLLAIPALAVYASLEPLRRDLAEAKAGSALRSWYEDSPQSSHQTLKTAE